MPLFLGIDTSNYKTSVALYDSESGFVFNRSEFLTVAENTAGLRQSEALFQHIKILPGLIPTFSADTRDTLRAVSASVSPRESEQSYMPCFLAGKAIAQSLAVMMDVPFFPFSHQQGHIASARFSDHPEILKSPFLCWHLSGGTTELLLVKPDSSGIPHAEVVGASLDISAGQAIDRVGLMLSLRFPAGEAVSKLAGRSSSNEALSPKIKGFSFSLSGLENKCMDMKKNDAADEDIARYVLLSILSAVDRVTRKALDVHRLPLLLSGGVMASTLIRQALTDRFNAVVIPEKYTGDNAAGIAFLASLAEGGII